MNILFINFEKYYIQKFNEPFLNLLFPIHFLLVYSEDVL